MPQKDYPKFSLSALLRLTRFWNLFIIGMAQYFAAIFLIDTKLLFDWKLLILASSTAIIAGAVGTQPFKSSTRSCRSFMPIARA